MKTKTSSAVRALVAGVAFLTAVPFLADAQQMVIKNLKQHVEEAYYRYYKGPINISVNDAGTVVLKGTVPTYWEKLNIYKNLSMVNGVTAITNNLRVVTDMLPDDIVKNDIVYRLKLHRVILQPDKINVAVNKGMAHLNGTLSYHKEAVAAEEIAGMASGVVSVVNDLEILPPDKAQSDDNLILVVRDVLKDQFPIGTENVKATVVKGILTLTGNVCQLALKQDLERQLHDILGIREVVNNLMVICKMPI